ncbi:MAG: hypothetical protein ACYC1D_19430 [Acidimicrobiales bacterium]
MASFTETVEARNPALTATGLAIWGWLVRVTVFVSYLILPHVINTVTPLVTYGPTVSQYAAGSPRYHIPAEYGSQIAFAQSHPAVVATAQKYSVQLADAQKYAPELAVIQAHPTLFAKLAADPTSGPLLQQAVAAGGGGAKGQAFLATLATHQAAIVGVINAAPQLKTLAPYAAQLTALSKVPPRVFAYLQAHGAAVAQAAKTTAGQWKTWYWICFGGMIFFLLTVPLMRGRWSPRAAKADEDTHEALVQAELAKLAA